MKSSWLGLPYETALGTIMKMKILDLKLESLPPSCVGPDGKFKRENSKRG